MKRRVILILFFIVAFYLTGCSSYEPIIIAHRGNSGYAPENTEAAVKSAWQVKADAVEVDVHITKDDQVVVLHDGNTKRTSGEDFVVENCSYADIASLDVGSHKGWHFRNERIPLLKDIIDTVPEGKQLFVEVKCSERIIPFLKDIFSKSGKIQQLCIISFNLELLGKAKKVMPQVPMYWLASPRKAEGGEYLPFDAEYIQSAKKHGLDGLNLSYGMLSESFVKQVHKNGLELFVWTVNYLPDAERMRAWGVDGITTNYPADVLMIFDNNSGCYEN
ncbi:Glycerophosphoryl diester phosphodiesterase [Sedimentisphaera cyanobacteriorum]|uniref:Glycerophosphoryl diester phosphodiesterase n=1 Tax=Sedimentisphaera cyanobacteriorum TaxID=1940790 RepID=A0A1Q2HS98_9BACT|nr:glycerophosphodiester phosphodiesterase family protein [Sedimentisphaera cyanobacteriorum]AQQ10260.1 Glycerophosphoryl diester phosphodiesterase [Sedimentisphaera cyanobacteriorum]